ncbi:hypothetical protein [Chryseobacterium populi]|uniref:Uncharacterized protein n=1 Tax=Chryseobacterium populi TaxID=1144316 RepID=J3CM09_9FLAO|nr:hypothetical protein [Chryseobacterium populi]EJL74354.1 hypothetical protein PMI13_01093 [Chryseobacterium populi]
MNDQSADELRYYRYLSQTLIIILGLVTMLSILLSIMLVYYSMKFDDLQPNLFQLNAYSDFMVL